MIKDRTLRRTRSIRFSDEEKDLFERAASLAGEDDMSTWLRKAGRAAALALGLKLDGTGSRKKKGAKK
jgi:uncharacterized protein (DUF1778 family)